MILSLFLHEANAHVFFKLLMEQIQRMNDKYRADGVHVSHLGHWESDSTYRWAARLSEDGCLYREEILISLPIHNRGQEPEVGEFRPKGSPVSMWQPADSPQSGYLVVDITPLGSPGDASNINVVIHYDPSEELPEVLSYFLELFEPMERAWGGVMRQLAEQSPALKSLLSDQNSVEAPPADETLDWLDQKILELVPKLRNAGYRVTDKLLATRILNPQTGEPYTRNWINRRRNRLRDRGYTDV